MKNMKFNLILSSLPILAIFALAGVFNPTEANAEYAYYHFNTSDNNAPLYPTPAPEVVPVYQPVYKTQPVIYQNQPVYQNNTSNAPGASTNTTSVSNSDTSYNSTTKTTSTGSTTSDYSNLAANSFFGHFSFLPSGLVQWILLAIFILIIIILIRRVTGKDEEYYAEPLKHA